MKKLPSIKTLKTEYVALKSEKNKLYSEYKKAKVEVKKFTIIKSNIEHFLVYFKNEKSPQKKILTDDFCLSADAKRLKKERRSVLLKV